jgi:acetyltransferase-like isoleucine patch superfamily enzyme
LADEGFFKHETAIVESSSVGAGTRVWAFAHILSGSVIGAACNICDQTFIESDVRIGDRVTIKCGVQIWDGITLEDDVFVGPNATFSNDPFPRSGQHPSRYARTVVKRGASIGANATILPGLRIGRYAMVAAGALVTADVPPFALVIGSPARWVADLCRCGRKLNESYQAATCAHCGETPELRCNLSELETVTL